MKEQLHHNLLSQFVIKYAYSSRLTHFVSRPIKLFVQSFLISLDTVNLHEAIIFCYYIYSWWR